MATGFESFIGASPGIIEIKRLAAKAAGSDVTVLITGESGTGKRSWPALSMREQAKLSLIPLAQLCRVTGDSIGIRAVWRFRGSFTGAVKGETGLFAAATDYGTFFLDEISETSPAIQAKLLRVLEEEEFTPLGATKAIAADVRLIAATNANLRERVEHGAFRADLFYRFNVFSINIQASRPSGRY